MRAARWGDFSRNQQTLCVEFNGFKQVRFDHQAGGRVSDCQRSHDAPFDVAFMRSENAQGHFDRKPLGEGFGVDVLKTPNQSCRRVALNKAAVRPFVANVDALEGIETGRVAETQRTVFGDAGGKHIFYPRQLVLSVFTLTNNRDLMRMPEHGVCHNGFTSRVFEEFRRQIDGMTVLFHGRRFTL